MRLLREETTVRARWERAEVSILLDAGLYATIGVCLW